MSINEEEVRKFSAMSDQWWDINGQAKPLHHINPARMEYILRSLNHSENILLDLGCGAGILTESLYKSGKNMLGIDASSKMIDIAKSHARENNLDIEYECLDITENTSRFKSQFHAIACMEILEHVDNISLILESCYSCLRPGGKLFLSTINRNIKSYLGAIVVTENILKLLPKGTHDYRKFIKPSELSQYLRDSGFEITDITGLGYNPLNNSAWLSSDVTVNYLIAAEKRK